MAINQLFCKKPDHYILKILLECFKLKNIEDITIFTKNDLKEYKTVDKIIKYKDDFIKYYLPCKGKKYLNDLNEKKSMTILKQIVKTFDYFIFSKEKYIDGEKFITYQLIPIHQKNILTLQKKDEKYIVNFD